jgi:hypothetical protein
MEELAYCSTSVADFYVSYFGIPVNQKPCFSLEVRVRKRASNLQHQY